MTQRTEIPLVPPGFEDWRLKNCPRPTICIHCHSRPVHMIRIVENGVPRSVPGLICDDCDFRFNGGVLPTVSDDDDDAD
jgi:hypothetical protein